MQVDTVYRLIASSVDARARCLLTMDTHGEWFHKHTETIEQLVRDFLPSGSGWDNGTKIDWDNSTGEKLVFFGSFHHMNDGGYYVGWTNHAITVRPSLIHGITLSISGRNRNDIKENLHMEFDTALRQTCYWNESHKRFQHTPV